MKELRELNNRCEKEEKQKIDRIHELLQQLNHKKQLAYEMIPIH